jgi:uncharacterized protein
LYLLLPTYKKKLMLKKSFEETISAYEQGDYEGAFKSFTQLAEQGDARAQNQLGHMYGAGEGVKRSDTEALYWYHRSAGQGFAEGQYKLGVLYWKKHSFEESAKWIRLAADQGHSNAQGHLGGMYRSGQGVAKDQTEAMRWFGLSAEQGNTDYQRILGVTYFKDGAYEDALKWLQFASVHGEPTAQEFLGVMYAKGCGVTQDLKEAARLFRLSANQGNAESQFKLGMMYTNGEGVPEDLKEAFKWLNLATEKKNNTARYHLGLMYAAGKGITQDRGRAYELLEMSALYGCSEAQTHLESLRNSISTKQIFLTRFKGSIQMAGGIGLWILGISLTASWLAFCFGTVVIGIILLLFAPYSLLVPWVMCTVPGTSLIFLGAKNFMYNRNDMREVGPNLE